MEKLGWAKLLLSKEHVWPTQDLLGLSLSSLDALLLRFKSRLYLPPTEGVPWSQHTPDGGLEHSCFYLLHVSGED